MTDGPNHPQHDDDREDRQDYSPIADEQLDALEAGPDAALFNAVLDACELIIYMPAEAQKRSTAITSDDGVVLSLPVAGFPPHRVWWTSGPPPRVEAVFPY